MVFEDAHWIDPSSLELLDLTVDRVRRLPVLLAITFRPEYRPPWGGRAHVTTLALNRLGERDGEAMVRTLAGNAALTAELVAEMVERADGVPLFVEELTKAVLESAVQGDQVAAAATHRCRAVGAGDVARVIDGSPGPARVSPPRRSRRSARCSVASFPMNLSSRWRSVQRRNCKPDWISSAMPRSCSVEVRFRTPPICSSMRWCWRLPTRLCCAVDARSCTRAWHRRCEIISQDLLSASRSYWRITSPPPVTPNALSING